MDWVGLSLLFNYLILFFIWAVEVVELEKTELRVVARVMAIVHLAVATE
jgi:hypothetical protein